jgi:hypothetical protein
MADLTFTNHGSIWLVAPQTNAGHEWLDEHIGDDALSLCGAIAVEPRYVGAIAEGAQGDGLTVEAED